MLLKFLIHNSLLWIALAYKINDGSYSDIHMCCKHHFNRPTAGHSHSPHSCALVALFVQACLTLLGALHFHI